MNIKEKFAFELAKEISHYRLYEVDEIVKVIMPYFKLMNKELLQDGINLYEKEYSELVAEQSLHVGSKRYLEFGLKIAANKNKRTELRIALNSEKRDDICERQKKELARLQKERDLLSNFIKENNGNDFYNILLPELKKIQADNI